MPGRDDRDPTVAVFRASLASARIPLLLGKAAPHSRRIRAFQSQLAVQRWLHFRVCCRARCGPADIRRWWPAPHSDRRNRVDRRRGPTVETRRIRGFIQTLRERRTVAPEARAYRDFFHVTPLTAPAQFRG